MGQEDWDLAGFTDKLQRLGRRIPGGEIIVPPKVELTPDQGSLQVSSWPPGEKKIVTPGRETLNSFVRLWGDPPRAILRFAKKWGVLRLGADGRPCAGLVDINRTEPLGEWRYFSKRACAVLNIAAKLKQGRVGLLDDWAALRGTRAHTGDFLEDVRRDGGLPFFVCDREYPFGANGFDQPGFQRKIKTELSFLFLELNLWLRLAGVGFILVPQKGKIGDWRLYVDLHGCMLSAVAMQLALALADVEALFVCSGCGCPYGRTQKPPKLGQANFCPSCGPKEALRQADRRRREKMAESRRLHADGVGLLEIAAKLNTKPATVRGWVKG
jgi:predicted RNA-binding Zn-ribbon protein involved in translation (DUF1610 family)